LKRTRVSREVQSTAPWFMRPGGKLELDAAPVLLSFDSDEFVDDFFEAVRRSSDSGLQPDHRWPRLLPYRDWSEPPRAMLDGFGEPRFPHGPDGIERQEPHHELVEGDPDDDRFPVPDEGGIGWLRKLYLPSHQRFNLVACELACRRPYLPPVSAERVEQAGLIVRRLVPGETVRWQDWVANERGRGMWVNLADARMHLPGTEHRAPRPHIDPDELPTTVELELARERLEIDTDKPLKLAVSPLSPVPQKHIRTERRGHTVLFGYLPVMSADLELARPVDPADLDRVRDKLAREAFENVRRLPEQADQMQQELWSRWKKLLEQFVVPDPAEVMKAREEAIEAIYDDLSWVVRGDEWKQVWDDEIDGALDELRDELVDELDPTTLPLGMLGLDHEAQVERRMAEAWQQLEDYLAEALPSLVYEAMWKERDNQEAFDEGWWEQVFDIVYGQVDSQSRPSALSKGARHRKILQGHLLRLVLGVDDHQESSFDELLGSGSQLDDLGAERRKLLDWLTYVLTRRIRMRRALALEEIYGQLPFPLEPSLRVEDDTQSPKRIRPELDLTPLGDELQAWMTAEDNRDERPLDWDKIDLSGLSWRKRDLDTSADEELPWHKRLLEIEAALGRIDRKLASAGLAYTVDFGPLKTRADEVAVRLSEAGTSDLAELKLDRQPLLGLMVFPGVYPTEASLRDILGDSAQDDAGFPKFYTEKLYRGVESKLEAYADARDAGLKPRYDSDHLYAVWCYARIAGRDECEADQIVWSRRTDVFSIAEPTDVLGVQPVAFTLPDLTKMLRDLPRIPKAAAQPFAMITTPQDSGIDVGKDVKDTRRKMGVAWLCSFGIPAFTIVAWILFRLVFAVLIALPGFAWLLLLKFCMPVPKEE
jgi:hypothetical protein